jgi:arabinofuranosyltransferase
VATTVFRGAAPAPAEAPPRRRRLPALPARARRWVPVLVLVAPAVLVLVGAWIHRWVDEDGFINLRVVDQIAAGHGPVFNEGERIEAFTSPLWIAVLVAGRFTLGWVLDLEWVAVVLGMGVAGAAFLIAGLGNRTLHPDAAVVVPLGVLLVAALPVVWDFATAGLEMGLVWLWLAASWYLLLQRARTGSPAAGWRRAATLAVVGLGPLVRPDLALMAAVFLGAWVLVARPRGRRLLADASAAAVLPVLYQLFRMGYYAAPVPNTGLAKDGSTHFLYRGVDYLQDLTTTYALWLPLVPVVVALLLTVRRRPAPVRVVVGAAVVAGLVHGAYIVFIGGDYMHGRLLLPALFALALPAALPVERRALPSLALVGGVVWAVVVVASVRYENQPGLGFDSPEIFDQRQTTPAQERVVRRPTMGAAIREAHERGERGVLTAHLPLPLPRGRPLPDVDPVPAPLAPDELLTLEASIGIIGYQAGPEVHVVDLRGLADPLTGRASVFQPWRYQAGHRKFLDLSWYHARYGFRVEDPHDDVNVSAVAAARRALSCPPLSDLLDAVSDPLTPGRFVRNVWHSVSYAGIDVPEDPRDAPGASCTTS